MIGTNKCQHGGTGRKKGMSASMITREGKGVGMEERMMTAIILEILNLERKNLRTGRKSDGAMVEEIEKIFCAYSQTMRTVK